MRLPVLALLLAALAACKGNVNDDDNPLALTSRVSISTLEVQGFGFSDQPDLSADGRYVVFRSSAANLVLGDTNGKDDVFLRDQAEDITYALTAATDVAIFTAPGGTWSGDNETQIGVSSDGHSSDPAISGDGNFVAFASYAKNLLPSGNPTLNTRRNVYKIDTNSRGMLRASTQKLGLPDTNGDSFQPAISGDGKHLVYTTTASDVTPVDSNGAVADVIHWTANVNRYISSSSAGVQANGASTNPRISPDGRWAVFQSLATNLDPLDADAISDVYLKDLVTDATVLVSQTAAGVKGNGASTDPSVSADGRYVAFATESTNFAAPDTNAVADLYVKDVLTGALVKLSVGLEGAEADGASRRPRISADGSVVVFDSSATNLVFPDNNGRDDVFLVEVAGGALRRVSVRTFGVEATNGDSVNARVSADGRVAVFESTSPNLVDKDTNSQRDVFTRGPLE